MIKIKKLKASFKGIKLPNIVTAGRDFEKELANRGNPVDPGQCADYPEIELEVKTKSTESKSANVIGTMSRTDIINTAYSDSSICKKMQQQLRVETEDGVIVEEDIFDFSPDFIQDLIKEAYEIGQILLNVKSPPNYINCTRYGYFEKRRHTEDSYMYRINVGAMKELEQMAKSTFNNIFDYK
jgi:hypothetical protein